MNIYKSIINDREWANYLIIFQRWVVFVAWSQDPFAMWGGQRSQRKRTHALHSYAQANRSVWSRIGIVTLPFLSKWSKIIKDH
jgi:hypothetical protein